MKSKIFYPASAVLLILVLASAALIYKFFYVSGNLHGQYASFLRNEYRKLPYDRISEPGKVAKFDRPDLAAIQNYYMTIDPQLKRVPLERLYKAYLETDKFRKSSDTVLNWSGISSDMGGRTRALMFDPNDETHRKIWAGSVTGGLWYNNDITSDTSSWKSVNDFWPSLSVSCLAFDPLNPMVFYCGTGEAQTAVVTYRESSGRGVGIMRSLDGGLTWELMPSTTGFAYITDILTRVENDTTVIYVGVVSGTYKGQNHQSQPSEGLFRSADHGETWQQVLPLIPGKDRYFSPSDIEEGYDGRLFVGTMPDIEENGGAYILYSDSAIQGTWTINADYTNLIQDHPQYNKAGRVMLANAPSNRQVTYAIIGSGYVNSSNGFNYFYGNYIIKTTDNGTNWTPLNIPPQNQWGNWANLAWHAFEVAVDPSDDNHVVIGGLDLYQSFNGGNTWTRISDWTGMYDQGYNPLYVHADIHTVIFNHPSVPCMVTGTDGGVFYTTGISSLNPDFFERNRNYSTLQFYSCDIHPSKDVVFSMGGLQDNGTLVYSGTPLTKEDMVSGGDGAYCFIDRIDPELFITSVYYNRYYFFYNQYFDYTTEQSGTFVNPAAYSSTHRTIVANAAMFNGDYNNQLYIIEGIPYNLNYYFVDVATSSDVPFSAIKMTESGDSMVVFAGTQAGQLFRILTPEQSPQVTEITGLDFPAGNISCVECLHSDTLLVTFSNYGVPSVWYSSNGGNTWSDIENNLPDMPVRWALLNPVKSSEALIASETGIWFNACIGDSSSAWIPVNTGMGNVRADMLSYREQDSTIIAATHGRGLFTAKWIPRTPQSVTAFIPNDFLTVFPNPASDYLNLKVSRMPKQLFVVEVFNLKGDKVITQNCQADENTIKLNIAGLQPGIFLIKLENKGTITSKKFIKK